MIGEHARFDAGVEAFISASISLIKVVESEWPTVKLLHLSFVLNFDDLHTQ